MKRINCFVSITVAALFGLQSMAQDAQSSSQQSRSQGASSPSSSSSGSSGAKVSLSQLPDEVQKAIRAEAGHLNIENVQKLNKNGQTCYQAAFDKNGMKSKLTVAEDGSLLRHEQSANIALIAQVPKIQSSGTTLNELPKQVQKTVKQLASTNKVGNISKTTESGQTLYHVAFNDAGVHTDLLLDEQGKLQARIDETALFVAPLRGSQAVTLQSAPQSVQQSIRQHAGASASVSDIDKGTWNGQTAYKVMVQKNGSFHPLLISESGEILQSQGQSAAGAAGSSQQGQSSQDQGSRYQNSQSQSSPPQSGDQ